MIVRRCLALTILACSLFLVQCLGIPDGKANLRVMALLERRLEEEGVTKDAVPPTTKKTTKTTVKKHTDTPTGPETKLVKPVASSTKTTKTTAPTEKTTRTSKRAAPTVTTTTKTEKTEAPVGDEDKEAAAPDEENQAVEYEPKHGESHLDDESHPVDESQPNDAVQANEKEEDSEPDEQPTDEDKSKEDEKKPDDEGQPKSKEDEPDGSTPTPDATSDLCANATSCVECEKAASNSTLDEEQTCVWKDSACKVVAKEVAPSDSKCDDNETNTHKATTSVEDEEEAGSFVPGLVVVVVVFGLLALRAYIENHDITIPGVGGGIPGAFRQQRSSGLRSSRHTETYVDRRSLSCNIVYFLTYCLSYFLTYCSSFLLQCPARWFG
jgi:hypothetical protein